MFKRNFKNVFVVFLGLYFSIISSSYALTWKYNLSAAVDEARKSGKYVFVDFEAQWCGWCKKMDAKTFADPKVAKVLGDNFICVKVDADKNPDLIRRYGVRGYPTVAFLNSNGVSVNQLSGYRDPKAFLAEVNKIVSKMPKGKKSDQGLIGELKEKIAPVKAAIKKAQAGKYLLSGIQFNTEKPSAIINDQLVHVGDKILDATVVKITEETVELKEETPEKIIKLKM